MYSPVDGVAIDFKALQPFYFDNHTLAIFDRIIRSVTSYLSNMELPSVQTLMLPVQVNLPQNVRQMLWEYLLVYCTSQFLRTMGEPPAPYHQELDQLAASTKSRNPPVPVPIIFLFSLLVSLRYILSFLVSFGRTVRFVAIS